LNILEKIEDFFTRSIVYVSYYRADLCKESEERRIEYFKTGQTTNHSPIEATLKKAGFRDGVRKLTIKKYVPVKLTLTGLNLIADSEQHHRLS
jgi:hypothetical protein